LPPAFHIDEAHVFQFLYLGVRALPCDTYVQSKAFLTRETEIIVPCISVKALLQAILRETLEI